MLITLARKPLTGSVVQCCLQHGCGAINVDASRIASSDDFTGLEGFASMKLGTQRKGESVEDWKARGKNNPGQQAALAKLKTLGRWPANVLTTAGSAVQMDEQSGIVATGTWNRQNDTAHPFGDAKNTPYETWYVPPKEAPSGASRYFKRVGSR